MKMFIKFLKGIALGIANIVPGFSGGTMAIMLNIYDDFVGMFADILGTTRMATQFLFNLTGRGL